jgi:hypothetical protein
VQYLALLLLPILAVYGVVWLIGAGLVWVVDWLSTLRERKRARIEREPDRKQAELRATIIALAEHLNMDAHEARKALIRESYLATSASLMNLVVKFARSKSTRRERPTFAGRSRSSLAATTRSALWRTSWNFVG